MTLSKLLSILRARWHISAALFGAVVTVALLASLILPKQYESTASIVVDLRSPDPITGISPQSMLSSSYLATQLDVLRSPRVALRVVEILQLAEDTRWRRDWKAATEGQGRLEDWIADQLLKQLEVKPARESNVMYVTSKARTPAVAQQLTNTFAQAYVDTTLMLRVGPAREYNKFFDTHAKQVRETLEQAQTKLSAFQQRRALFVTDEKLDLENTRLTELTSQLVALQATANDSQSRQGEALRNSEQLQEVTNNPVIRDLKTKHAEATTRLRELHQRLGDRHPQIIDAEAIVSSLDKRIAEETRTLAGGVGLSDRVNQQRVQQLQTSIASQRTKVLAMKADRDEAAVLQRDVENAQKAYDAIVNRVNQSNLESQTQLSNVSVLSPAPLPLTHASPKLLRNLVLSIAIGAVLALGAAVTLEVFDRRVRDPADVAEAVGLVVIGAMPLREAGLPPQRRMRLPKPRRALLEGPDDPHSRRS